MVRLLTAGVISGIVWFENGDMLGGVLGEWPRARYLSEEKRN